MKSYSLPDIYRSTNLNTIRMWENNAEIGNIREENYYDPLKLALATGIKPRMPILVSQLIDELNELTRMIHLPTPCLNTVSISPSYP